MTKHMRMTWKAETSGPPGVRYHAVDREPRHLTAAKTGEHVGRVFGLFAPPRSKLARFDSCQGVS